MMEFVQSCRIQDLASMYVLHSCLLSWVSCNLQRCYIPNFAKCSLVPCSDSTPIPSLILIYYFICSILIWTPFYNSPYKSFLSSFPTHAHIPISTPYDYSPIFVTMTLHSYVSDYHIPYFLWASICNVLLRFQFVN